MPRKQIVIPPSGNEGRGLYLPSEWRAIKEAVDCYRAGDYAGEDINTLIHFELWDHDNYCLDEKNLNDLYMEYC